ncbi:hypothetical protein JHS3_29110 [Jeongeupia sp. HS-3]|uniref:DUF805 domain-containing protein n=1 Tax=Jeongeupia sp. HS-3 TaxID=1009682 RepID=UPI0018A3C167|nr:DUF805 domain-containing protein [Jeongeupia sp. HS-3]BCL77175.1 hypothetical protein JHS3_29110 [Jeongeupia sp. HS-3]
MSDHVRLVLTGDLLPGVSTEAATDKLAALLKTDAGRVARLLDSAPAVIKQRLARDQLAAYLARLDHAGVVVRVESLAHDPMQLAAQISPPVGAPLALADEPAEPMSCPACNKQQARRTLCLACGADMPRLLAAQTPAAGPASQPGTVVGSPSPRSAQVEPAADYLTPPLLGLLALGRLGRMRYLAYSMIFILAAIAVALLAAPLLFLFKGASVAFAGALAWVSLRFVVLRLHDFDFSGWWLAAALLIAAAGYGIDARLGMLLSGVLTLASLALGLIPGDAADNRFGPPAEPPTALIQIGGVLGLIISVLSAPAALQWPRSSTPSVAEVANTQAPTGHPADRTTIYDNHGREITDARIHQLGEQLRANGANISDAEVRAKLLRKQLQRQSGDD